MAIKAILACVSERKVVKCSAASTRVAQLRTVERASNTSVDKVACLKVLSSRKVEVLTTTR